MSTARTGLLKALRRGGRTTPSITPSSLGLSAALGRRHASHEEHYNEPSGFLFSELVSPYYCFHRIPTMPLMVVLRLVLMFWLWTYYINSPERTGQNVQERIGSSSGTLEWEEACFLHWEYTISGPIQGISLDLLFFLFQPLTTILCQSRYSL